MQDAHPQYEGPAKPCVQHPAPFSGATNPSLIVCRCLLKLRTYVCMYVFKSSPASNTGGVWKKIANFGENLVNHCWTVACHQHFDGPVQVVACVRRPSRATNKRRRATHQWIVFVTEAEDVMLKKFSKMQRILHCRGRHWATAAPCYTFLEISCQTLIDT